MQEFLNALLTAIISVCVPFLTGVIAAFIKKAAERAAERAQSEQQRQCIREIAGAVETAVSFVSQTYVDSMKGQNLFDAEAQRVALERSVEAAMQILSPAAADLIAKCGSPDDYLRPLVEAEVRRQKNV